MISLTHSTRTSLRCTIRFSQVAREQVHWRAGRAPQEQRASWAQRHKSECIREIFEHLVALDLDKVDDDDEAVGLEEPELADLSGRLQQLAELMVGLREYEYT